MNKVTCIDMDKEVENFKLNKVSEPVDLTDFDVIAEEAYNDYVKDGKKSRPIQKIIEECDL